MVGALKCQRGIWCRGKRGKKMVGVDKKGIAGKVAFIETTIMRRNQGAQRIF